MLCPYSDDMGAVSIVNDVMSILSIIQNYGEIKYIKEGISNLISQDSIVYTSGTGAIFKSGIPIGRVDVADTGSSKKFKVDFYSDFSQLKYVFAELVTKIEVKNEDLSLIHI